MTDSRQCARCGALVPSPDGAALDAAHDCPHGVKCEATGNLYLYRCQACVAARLDDMRAKVGDVVRRVADSLPGARAALLGGPGVRGGP